MNGAQQRTLVVGVVKSCDLVGGLGNKATVKIAWTSQYVITSHPLDIVGATHCRRERRACGRVPPIEVPDQSQKSNFLRGGGVDF